MLTVVIGLVAALVYGSADFLGGISARRISPMRTTAIAAFAGLALLLVLTPFVGGAWSPAVILWGGLSGISGALAISLLYACLAIGPMSILSPLTAIVSAIVPMTWGLFGGERFAPIGYVALALALIAVVLVGFVPEKGAVRPSLRGILMAIGAGSMIGVFLILLDATPDDSGLAPLIMNRAVNGTIMFAAIGLLALWQSARHRRTTSAISVGTATQAATADAGHAEADAGRAAADAASARWAGWRPGLRFAIWCGLVDATANALMLIGLRIGDLSIVAVLTALYPAGTILLAAIVLRERVAPIQWVGLVLAVGAGCMLALA